MPTRLNMLKNYPTIAHNYITHGRVNNKARGFNHLLTWEPYVVRPQNWNVDIINQYASFISFNRKFCESQGITAKCYITDSCSNGSIEVDLNTFKSYDEKIKGICVLGKRGHNKRDGNIYYLREEFLDNLLVEPFLVKHLYAHNRWGDSYYQGRCEPYDPWGFCTLKKVSEYLFCFCPENTYHSLWSWGYLTERLFRCFKAKTVPIYIGCYNIENLVPKDLFIDFRDFRGDYNRLAEYLIKFPKEKYLAMVERAYKWDKTCRLHSAEDFENMLKIVIGKEK
ncbi:MAG: glycosyltransferase family 10 [Nitrosopumilus sp.]